MQELVPVYTHTNPLRAEMTRNLLAREGIPCLLGGISQAATAGVPGTLIQVQVPKEYADKARSLLKGEEKKGEENGVEDS